MLLLFQQRARSLILKNGLHGTPENVDPWAQPQQHDAEVSEALASDLAHCFAEKVLTMVDQAE
jgi:hypothetical protein